MVFPTPIPPGGLLKTSCMASGKVQSPLNIHRALIPGPLHPNAQVPCIKWYSTCIWPMCAQRWQQSTCTHHFVSVVSALCSMRGKLKLCVSEFSGIFFSPNMVDLQFVESTEAKPADMKGQLYMLLTNERRRLEIYRKKGQWKWNVFEVFQPHILASSFIFPSWAYSHGIFLKNTYIQSLLKKLDHLYFTKW